MIGKHTGVATRLKNRQPILTSNHCLAHQLALAASQAGGNVKFINDTFKLTLHQLFIFMKIAMSDPLASRHYKIF